ncbi:DUF362 domain-containing protein [Marispirochaeta sp.]|uniref:DUF362 domain-containing protein n=1 Tax=Marispirochaeta sp. TaxID=2038653 RepID=UPI0029C65230|nr:DUF362 domain-containing protein [Marispirochaeta sp.]
MRENEILHWFGTDPFEAGRELMKASGQWQNWGRDELIGLKPNLVVAKKASSGATTHPAFVAGAISFLQEKGFRRIQILEGSWVGDSTKRAFKVCGYNKLSDKYDVPLIDLQKNSSVVMESTNGEYRICSSVLQLDRLINMPVLKGHCQTSLTCALKNLKGCIPDSEKRRYHRMGLHQPIADLNEIVRADLILVDGLEGDPDYEEGGNPVRMNLFFAGTDPVLIDSYAAGLLGLQPEEVAYIGKAAALGIGSQLSDETKLRYLNKGEAVEGIQRSVAAYRLKEIVREDGACSACYASLMRALSFLEKEDNFPSAPVHIGQGYRGTQVSGVGIGICLKGADSYAKGCPPEAAEIYRFFKDGS